MSHEEVDLTQWDKTYRDHEPPPPGDFDDLPDGKYVGKIYSAKLKNSKKGNPMLEMEFDVVGGQHYGRKLWKYNVMKTAENIQYLKNDLVRCGLLLERLSDLNSRLGELIGRNVKLVLKTPPGKDQQTWINGLAADGDESPMQQKPQKQKAAQQQRPQQSQNVPSQDNYDDDLPF